VLKVTICVNDGDPIEVLEIVNRGPVEGVYASDDGPGGMGARSYTVRRADGRPPTGKFIHRRRDGALVCVAHAIETLLEADEEWSEGDR